MFTRVPKFGSSQSLVLLILVMILAPLSLSAQSFTSTTAGDILSQFRNQKTAWTTNIWVYANNLFGILALIEFAWSAAVMLLERSDLQSWTAALVRRIMWIGFFYALLLNGHWWVPAIVDSFTQIGAGAAGFTKPLVPSDVLMQGIGIAGALVDAASSSGFFSNPGTSLILAFCAVLIAISYIIITLNFIVTMVETYLLLSVGFIFLGFGGSRWTAPYVERYIALTISIGVKILVLYCLIAAGFGLGVGWLSEAQGIGTSTYPTMTAFDVLGAAVIFMMLCWQIPKLFSAVLGGTPILTGGDLVSTGAGIVAGAVTVASLGAGAAALGARGVAAAAGAAGTAGAASAGGSGSGAASAVAAVGPRPGDTGGGGTVPPPSGGPPPNGNGGRPKQPDPPSGGSAGAAVSVSNVSSGPNGSSSSASVNGVDRSSSGSSGTASGTSSSPSSVTSALSPVGGDSLAGSGFERERPARGFAPLSVSGGSSAVSSPPRSAAGSSSIHATPRSGLSVGDAIMWSPGGLPALPPPGGVSSRRAASPGVVAGFADNGRVMVRSLDGELVSLLGGSNNLAPSPPDWVRPPTGSEQQAYGAEFAQLGAVNASSAEPGAASQQGGSTNSSSSGSPHPPAANRREKIGSTARKADRVFSEASDRLNRVADRLRKFPVSDAAPPSTPPRMPIEHHD